MAPPSGKPGPNPMKASIFKEGNTTSPIPITIGIGASAGGHEALEKIFTAIPADSNLSFVVIMHLPAEGPSLLADIIRRFTSMQVVTVEDGMPLLPNTVHVPPPGRDLTVNCGRLHLHVPEGEERPHLPIDHFFSSLAAELGKRSVAVVLSGFGGDGSVGAKRVKEAGGIVIVQDPDSAKSPSMPQRTIATAAAEFVLPPLEIANKLIQIARGECYLPSQTDLVTGQNDDLHTLFTILKTRTGHDFSSYKRNTILRRIERRMDANMTSGLKSYLDVLTQKPLEAQALCQDLLISVTSFFRDPEAFEILRSQIIPRLFADKDPEEPIRIWDACCATGKEVYSVAMLVLEHMEQENLHAKIQIFATDIDELAVDQARSGLYSDDIKLEVGEDRLKRFFVRFEGQWRVAKLLREMIVFAHHNIIKDPPFSRLDLLVCRNFLIYLNPEIQKLLIPLFHQVLKPGGHLFLGSAETVGVHSNLFIPVDKRWKIFMRQWGESRVDTLFPFSGPVRKLADIERSVQSCGNHQELETIAHAEKLLMERYVPARIIINEKNEVIHFSNRAGAYLITPEGKPTWDLLRIAREDLRPALRAATYKAFTTQKEIEYRGIKMVADGGETTVNIIVVPLKEPPRASKLALVILEPLPSPLVSPLPIEKNGPDGDTSRNSLTCQLEEQLRVTGEQLQSTSEQLETSHERFMLVNEELMTVNEELQSTNEELQSTNEEVVTVNSELQRKMEELNQSNTDLENLFASSGIAIIFLDRELTIKRFSPAMAVIFNLIPADIGRPFRHLNGAIDWSNLPDDVKSVLEKLVPVEREVHSLNDCRTFIMRTLAYQTMEGLVDGIVVMLIDITQRKRIEEALQESENRLGLFIDQAPASLAMFDTEMRYLKVSRRWLDDYGLGDADLMGKSHYDIFPESPGEWRERHQRGLTGEILRADADRFKRADGSERWVRWEIRPWIDATERIGGIVIFTEDITDIKKAEEILRRYELLVEQSWDIILFIRRNDGRIMDANAAALKAYGYTHEELLKLTIKDLRSPEAVALADSQMSKADMHGVLFETVHCRRDGTHFPVEVSSKGAEFEGVRVLLSVVRDTTERKLAEESLRASEVKFRAIADHIHDWEYWTGVEGNLIYVSPSCERITSYKAEEFYQDSRLLTRIIHPDDSDYFMQHAGDLTKGTSKADFQEMDFRIITRNGEERWIAHICKEVFDQEGNSLGRRVRNRDITDRKLSEYLANQDKELRLLALEATGLGTWHYNIKTGDVSLDKRSWDLWGIPEGDRIDYAAILNRIHPEDREDTVKAFKQALSGMNEETIQCEFRVDRSDGSEHWIAFHGRVYMEGDRKHRHPVYIAGVNRDITEEKRSELTQAKLAAIVESSDDAIISKDLNGIIYSWNTGAERLFGYRSEEITGRPMTVLIPPDKLNEENRILQRLSAGNRISHFETIRVAKDGRKIDVSLTVSPIKDTHGKIIGISKIARDITERKKNEVELAEYAQRLKLATSSGKLAVWDWNVKDNIMFWDDRMFEFYGITRDAFPNTIDAWINGIHPDDKQRAIEESNAACLGKKEFNTVFRVLRPDGTIRHLKSNAIIIKDDSGNAIRMIGINTDITEQIQAEEERQTLEDHLLQAQKMEAIGTLAGGIAHDFNNILTAILGFSEMAYEDSLSGSVKPSDLNQVIQASHRAKDLVKQILAFSRQAEAQKIPMRPVAMVKESIKLLRSSLPTTIDIQQDIDSETDPILADPTQIHQIMINLCTNAYHAMEEKGGTLSISLKNKTLTQQNMVNFPGVQPGHFIQLSIKDTGLGIAPEIRDRIFDPYFTTKEAGKGTGMGLSIVHGIVKSYGGSITCRSETGAGTLFEICLPAILEQIVPESQEFEMVPVGTECILFIDDEEILAKMGQTMLERLGYTVTVKMNGIEALATYKAQPEAFDLVITDQTMPGITGIDLARRMLQIRPGMPIILCTGYSSQISEEKAKASGIKGFTMKPLARKNIAVLIRKVLDQGKKGSS